MKKIDAITVKNDLFYRPKWNLDIEHIISHRYSNSELNEEDKIENSIGNLMYLDRSLNRKLGEKTRRAVSVQKDYNDKIDWYGKKNKDMKLQCVTAFRGKYKSGYNPEDMIKERKADKVKFLNELYKGYREIIK